jgi:hypothetical protein
VAVTWPLYRLPYRLPYRKSCAAHALLLLEGLEVSEACWGTNTSCGSTVNTTVEHTAAAREAAQAYSAPTPEYVWRCSCWRAWWHCSKHVLDNWVLVCVAQGSTEGQLVAVQATRLLGHAWVHPTWAVQAAQRARVALWLLLADV